MFSQIYCIVLTQNIQGPVIKSTIEKQSAWQSVQAVPKVYLSVNSLDKLHNKLVLDNNRGVFTIFLYHIIIQSLPPATTRKTALSSPIRTYIIMRIHLPGHKSPPRSHCSVVIHALSTLVMSFFTISSMPRPQTIHRTVSGSSELYPAHFCVTRP